MKSFRIFLFAAGLVLSSHAVRAQTLVDEWSFSGGGLNPATYGGAFKPSSLVADAGSTGGSTISVTGMGSTGGLGSSGGFSTGYGGYYTFFSTNASFTLQTTTILPGLDTITITILAGGGSPSLLSYDASTLVLNYNGANSAVASSTFSAITGIVVPSPIGDQDLTLYSWTWTNLSELGTSTGFSTSWNTQGNAHVFYSEMSATQAVPEPAAWGLLALGGALAAGVKRWQAGRPARAGK